MRERIIILSLFILSIVFIALFFVVTPSYITENGDVKHFEDNDYSFDIANTWTVYEYDDAMKTPFLSNSPNAIIVNPVDNSQFRYYNGSFDDLTEDGEVLNTSATNATDVAIVKTDIIKYDSLPPGVSFEDAYKADSLYSLMESSGKFDLKNTTDLTIDGKQAIQFEYTVIYITYQDTWINDDGHYIRIFSQAPNTFYENAEPQFDFIVNTFKVK